MWRRLIDMFVKPFHAVAAALRVRRRWAVAAVVVFALLPVAGGAVMWWGREVFERHGSNTSSVTVVVPHGLGISRIAELLFDRSLLQGRSGRYVFVATVKLGGKALQAGEYEFPAGASIRAIEDIMESGATVVRRLTLPEGLTSAQMVAAVARAEGLDGAVPARPTEGTLLPATYHYSWGDNRQALLARMQKKMTEVVESLWRERTPGAVDDMRKAVILASIVERETSLPVERTHVAGVFLNRLRLGMKLQSDPTVVYALNGGSGPLGRSLTKADLAMASPYNTYLNVGLPPGPICNPGTASIAAVLKADVTNDLYFVADGTGGHVFSSSLQGHNRNVAKWRGIEKATHQH